MSLPKTRSVSSLGDASDIRKKRRVDWGEEDSDDELLALKTVEEIDRLGSGRLYEILASVRRLRIRFQNACPYFVPRTLLYEALVGGEGSDRMAMEAGSITTTSAERNPRLMTATDVDLGLEELKQKKLLMELSMPSVGDGALIETDDYRDIVRRVLERGCAGREGVTGREKSACNETQANQLDVRLQQAGRFFQDEIVGKYAGPTFQLPKRSEFVGLLDDLVKHELLIRMPGGMQSPGVDAFGFKVPGSGNVMRSIADGRTELLSRIKRKRHREMLESKILKDIKLRKSNLGIDWHIADLVGSGLVHVIPTTVGPLLRLVVHEHESSE